MVATSIKKALLQIGAPELEKVTDLLLEKHNCHLSDCYDHPEYLNDILKEIYGACYNKIVDSIQEDLGASVKHNQIEPFIQKVRA